MPMFESELFLKHLTTSPGVYVMKHKAEVLYVGKAKNLKNRLTSYFRKQNDPRLEHMVSQIDSIETLITHNEKEAFLLEFSLIKSLKPKYNIIFKDDKSYPYICLSVGPFPRLTVQRGLKQEKVLYRFGPYPSQEAVYSTLDLLRSLFQLRSCSDVFFKNRSRPCLEYQLKRCSAPCTAYISEADYQQAVMQLKGFLEGKKKAVIADQIALMQQASIEQNFEKAAYLRDRIAKLKQIIEQQSIYGNNQDPIDVIVLLQDPQSEMVCIYVLLSREGRWMGSEVFFPTLGLHEDADSIMTQFMMHYYARSTREFPKEIIINLDISNPEFLREQLVKSVTKKVRIRSSVSEPLRGQKARFLDFALNNARASLEQKLARYHLSVKRYEALATFLGLTQPIKRMECFDVSHTLGEASVASCVVFDQHGPLKTAYRRFNLGLHRGDDCAALTEALYRHYIKQAAEAVPDVLFIDGAKAQLKSAQAILQTVGVSNTRLIGISKGEGRKAGLETLWVSQVFDSEIKKQSLPADSPALHLIQAIRDEAHRFAIRAHRKQRDQKRGRSILENIPGLGAARSRKLIAHFGSLDGLIAASVESITQVSGISITLAKIIYAYLHEP